MHLIKIKHFMIYIELLKLMELMMNLKMNLKNGKKNIELILSLN